jgi:FRG domain-containing protein
MRSRRGDVVFEPSCPPHRLAGHLSLVAAKWSASVSDTECSWDEFKQHIAALLEETRFDHNGILFRGHASSKWPLKTTLERSGHAKKVVDHYRLVLRLKSEIQAYLGRNWPDEPGISELGKKLTADYSSYSDQLPRGSFPHYSYLAYLRHHGFPSPLLDWTTSPYVAAFFAFRAAPPSKHIAIFAFRERDSSGRKMGGMDLPEIRVLSPHIEGPRRHFAQRSQYTVCTMWSDDGPYYYDHSKVCAPFDPDYDRPQQDIIYKFVLPASERLTVLRELDDFGLNAYTLFGSEDSLMEGLSSREEARK